MPPARHRSGWAFEAQAGFFRHGNCHRRERLADERWGRGGGGDERRKGQELGLRPRLVLRSYTVSGGAPEIMGIGPVEAGPRALEQAGLTLDDMDVIELNEAFAVQALSVIRELDLPIEKVNVNGGAVALGHPLGCTGARMTLTALGELERREARYALVTMCIGGGMGAAGVFERI